MLRLVKAVVVNSKRTFKNFGHKRQPVPGVTVLWHGFLTFTFIGLCIEWKRLGRLIFGTRDSEDAGGLLKQGANQTIDK